MKPIRGLAVLLLSLVIISCTSSALEGEVDELKAEIERLSSTTEFKSQSEDSTTSSSSTTSSTSSTTTTSTVPTRATEISKESFRELAHSLNFIDYSKQIESECGVFGLIVLADRIMFYQWLDGTWVDRSELLGPDGDLIPTTVKSYDFTGDGHLDMFIHYDSPHGWSSFGSMFWQDNCVWDWAKFTDGSGEATYLYEGLAWDPDRSELRSSYIDWIGNTVEIGATFDRGKSIFVVETLSVTEPPSSTSPPAVVSRPTQTTERYVVRTWVECRENGLSSSWHGQNYTFTEWAEWSDYSRSIRSTWSQYGGCY